MRRFGGGVTKRQAGRCGLTAAALAFVLQLVAWAWSPAMLAALAAGTASQEIVICSVDGMTTVTLDENGEPTQPKAATGCPLCPLIAGLAPPPLPPMLEAPARLALHTEHPLPGQQVAAGWFLAKQQARAPPVAAV